MIDSPSATERLIVNLTEALPFFAKLSPPLAAAVKEHVPDIEVPERCEITRIEYGGEAAGIMCHFAVPTPDEPQRFVVSITHLMFDHTAPSVHRILSYRERRTRRLRNEGRLAAAPFVAEWE
jgi:hypothetical protein